MWRPGQAARALSPGLAPLRCGLAGPWDLGRLSLWELRVQPLRGYLQDQNPYSINHVRILAIPVVDLLRVDLRCRDQGLRM